MNYQEYAGQFLPRFEKALQQILSAELGPNHPELNSMLFYHMGWEGPDAGPKAQGKRIRPLLLLLSAAACGKNWEDFLYLAASVELVHNFSLIHDDIEDNSPLRRGRETVWKRWGIPQGINTGDLMFTVAHKVALGGNSFFDDHTTLEASRILQQTCVHLTQGQYMDMDFEKRLDVTSDEYLTMIGGKTSALFGCCTELGAITSSEYIRSSMKQYGISLGLAFQIQDDILGLWGDSLQTGKSTDSDLVSGKKTFPILYALQNNQKIRERWQKGVIQPQEAKEIARQLKEDGTFAYTKSVIEKYTQQAIQHIKSTGIENDAMSALVEITSTLTARNS